MLLIDRYTIAKLNSKNLKKYKCFTLFLTLLLTICGFLCLCFPFRAGVALSYLTGVVLLFCGMYTFLFSCTFKKTSKFAMFLTVILGIVYAGLGICVFLSPILGINILSATICFFFLLAGISRISASLKNPKMIGYFWCLLIGLMDLVIAFIWIGSSEKTLYMLTSVFFGLEMITYACAYFTLCKNFDKSIYISSDDEI